MYQQSQRASAEAAAAREQAAEAARRADESEAKADKARQTAAVTAGAAKEDEIRQAKLEAIEALEACAQEARGSKRAAVLATKAQTALDRAGDLMSRYSQQGGFSVAKYCSEGAASFVDAASYLSERERTSSVSKKKSLKRKADKAIDDAEEKLDLARSLVE